MYSTINLHAVEVAAVLEMYALNSEGPEINMDSELVIVAPVTVGSFEFCTLTPCIEGRVSTAILYVPPTPPHQRFVMMYY